MNESVNDMHEWWSARVYIRYIGCEGRATYVKYNKNKKIKFVPQKFKTFIYLNALHFLLKVTRPLIACYNWIKLAHTINIYFQHQKIFSRNKLFFYQAPFFIRRKRNAILQRDGIMGSLELRQLYSH